MKYLLILAAMALAACGASDDSASDETVGTEIAEDFNDAMEKAENVEQQIEDARQRMDEALDNAADAVEEDDDGVNK